MEKIRILIADEDCRMLNSIECILNQNFVSVEVVAKTRCVESTISAIVELCPSVVILAIHLKGGTALEVVRNTNDQDFKVIFMSTYQEYALDDIRFSSIDFFYKPLDISEFLMVVDLVISNLIEVGYKEKLQIFLRNTDKEKESKQIVFKTRSKIISVVIGDIIYGRSIYGGSCFYFDSQQEVEISQPLREYESMLHEYMFYRCHSHYIINLRQIQTIDFSSQNVIMNNGQLVPIELRKIEILESLLREVETSVSVSYSDIEN